MPIVRKLDQGVRAWLRIVRKVDRVATNEVSSSYDYNLLIHRFASMMSRDFKVS